MKNIFPPILFLFAFGMLVPSCKKSELTKYDEPPMVFVYKNGYNDARDSTTYSFATQDPALMLDTVKIPLRVMGYAADKDRTVSFKILTDSSTAVEGTHFEFGNLTIPAGTFTGDAEILVKKSAELKQKELRLWLEITENEDFRPGVPNTTANNSFWGGGLKYLIKVNDFLTKPANWDTRLVYYFGAYSQTKYRFIIDVTGRTEFPHTGDNALAYGEFVYYGAFCKSKLQEYVKANGPLIDESGNEVSFP